MTTGMRIRTRFCWLTRRVCMEWGSVFDESQPELLATRFHASGDPGMRWKAGVKRMEAESGYPPSAPHDLALMLLSSRSSDALCVCVMWERIVDKKPATREVSLECVREKKGRVSCMCTHRDEIGGRCFH